jgi:hypothetical protein
MKRPTAVRVFGRNYTITYVPAPSYGKVPLGNCENDKLNINITDGQHPIEERDTVLHEVIHAIFYTIQIPLKDEGEEGVVRPLATALLGVFQDKPEFAKYITKKEK